MASYAWRYFWGISATLGPSGSNIAEIPLRPQKISPGFSWPYNTIHNATNSVTWTEAQNFCHSEDAYSSHLVEIFSQEQQDFAVMKIYEVELHTGSPKVGGLVWQMPILRVSVGLPNNRVQICAPIVKITISCLASLKIQISAPKYKKSKNSRTRN